MLHVPDAESECVSWSVFCEQGTTLVSLFIIEGCAIEHMRELFSMSESSPCIDGQNYISEGRTACDVGHCMGRPDQVKLVVQSPAGKVVLESFLIRLAEHLNRTKWTAWFFCGACPFLHHLLMASSEDCRKTTAYLIERSTDAHNNGRAFVRCNFLLSTIAQ